MHRLRFPAIVGACLLLSMTGFACGSNRPARDAQTSTSTTAAAAEQPLTNLVSNGDIRRTKFGTPERAIMKWAQAVQFDDPAAVRAAYSERVRDRVSLARMYAAAKLVSSLLGRPEIVNSTVRNTDARIRVALISYDGTGRRSQQPTTFRLVKEDGRWRFDDAELLLETAAQLRRARR